MYNEFKKSIKLWNYSYNSVTIVKNLPNTQELDYAIYRKKRNDLTIYLTKKGAYRAFFEYHGDKKLEYDYCRKYSDVLIFEMQKEDEWIKSITFKKCPI